MVPALMSLFSFSYYNTSKFSPCLLLHPWLTYCQGKTKHISMPSLEQCMCWINRWYTSAKWPATTAVSMMQAKQYRIAWMIMYEYSPPPTLPPRCNFTQNLTILYLWNLSSFDRFGWKRSSKRRCMCRQQDCISLVFQVNHANCPLFPT